jgi:hypothetical protein
MAVTMTFGCQLAWPGCFLPRSTGVTIHGARTVTWTAPAEKMGTDQRVGIMTVNTLTPLNASLLTTVTVSTRARCHLARGLRAGRLVATRTPRAAPRTDAV